MPSSERASTARGRALLPGEEPRVPPSAARVEPCIEVPRGDAQRGRAEQVEDPRAEAVQVEEVHVGREVRGATPLAARDARMRAAARLVPREGGVEAAPRPHQPPRRAIGHGRRAVRKDPGDVARQGQHVGLVEGEHPVDARAAERLQRVVEGRERLVGVGGEALRGVVAEPEVLAELRGVGEVVEGHDGLDPPAAQGDDATRVSPHDLPRQRAPVGAQPGPLHREAKPPQAQRRAARRGVVPPGPEPDARADGLHPPVALRVVPVRARSPREVEVSLALKRRGRDAEFEAPRAVEGRVVEEVLRGSHAGALCLLGTW